MRETLLYNGNRVAGETTSRIVCVFFHLYQDQVFTSAAFGALVLGSCSLHFRPRTTATDYAARRKLNFRRVRLYSNPCTTVPGLNATLHHRDGGVLDVVSHRCRALEAPTPHGNKLLRGLPATWKPELRR